MDWQELRAKCNECNGCPLSQKRTNVVFGRGSESAPVLFVGEAPGREEDQQGVPFVGQAGRLFDLALKGIGFPQDSYYIANVLKCRPEKNRDPLPEEAEKCLPWLRAQTKLLRPRIIVCLGNIALRNLIDKNASISKARGEWYVKGGIHFMATYHPAALLRNSALKADFWRDLMAVRDRMTSGE